MAISDDQLIDTMKKASEGSPQKSVEPNAIEMRRGSQISVYFDADDMELLTKIKYNYTDVPRGKVLKYALGLLKDKMQDKTLTTSELMGYKS